MEIKLRSYEKPIIGLEEVNLTEKQKVMIQEIHRQLREMEKINNSGKAHYLIALLEELTAGVFAISYIKEKLSGLFSDV